MAQKKRSYKGKKQFGTYESMGRYAKNKRAKIERHLKLHPGDPQAVKALKSIDAYSRKAPVMRGSFPAEKGYVHHGTNGMKELWHSPASGVIHNAVQPRSKTR